MPAADGYWLFDLVESLDELGLDEEPEPLDWPVVEPEPELELEDDGEDGVADGLDGLLELEELDGELGELFDGLLDMLPEELPEAPVLPVPDEPPRSHAAIMLAPSATETATARVESFMLPP